MKISWTGATIHAWAAGGSALVALLAVYAGGLTGGRTHAAALVATRPAVIQSVVVTTTTHLPTPSATASSTMPPQSQAKKQDQPDNKRPTPSDGTKSHRGKGHGPGHHGH